MLLAVALAVTFWLMREAGSPHAQPPATVASSEPSLAGLQKRDLPRPAPVPRAAEPPSPTRDAGPSASRGPTDARLPDPSLFGKLVSLGQGFTLSETLAKNAQSAEQYLDQLCQKSARLRARPPLRDLPKEPGHDAAEFMAPLIDYAGPHDQPPGRLHISDELRAKLAGPLGADWGAKVTAADLAAIDFSWLTALAQFDHWSLLGAGRLRDYRGTDFFNMPIPNYISLQQWAKLRFALARRRGDHAVASAEVRHLADLVRTQGVLIAEAIAVAIYKIDASARVSAQAAGADIADWNEPDTASLELHRQVEFASTYFTYPGVNPETVRKAVGCMPSPCVALLQGAGANRGFGAFASTDNLQLVRDLAAANHCEVPLFAQAAISDELRSTEVLEHLGLDLEAQIPKYFPAP